MSSSQVAAAAALQQQIQTQNFGVSNLLSSLATGGSTSALSSSSSAARSMNFASVAASGITSSMSTTTAQMSTAGGVNGVLGGGIMSAIGNQHQPLSNLHQIPLQQQQLGHGSIGSGHQQQLHDDKADAAKAPGYRGNTSMSSPVMRSMPQHPSQLLSNNNNPHESQVQSGRYNLSELSSLSNPSAHSNNVMNFNARSGGPGYNSGNVGQFQGQDNNMGLMNSGAPLNGGNHMMYQQQQQQQNNRCVIFFYLRKYSS